MIILGGGLVKHHTCNANLMRNGADWAVFVNTGQEFDGSDSGARPDEAISWGKIKLDAKPVKIYAEATIVFPLLVAQTFAKDFVGTPAATTSGAGGGAGAGGSASTATTTAAAAATAAATATAPGVTASTSTATTVSASQEDLEENVEDED